MTQPFDICIRGDGMVGRTLALLLARERLRVGLVSASAATSRSGSVADTGDVRAYALNAQSRSLLESLRCWPEARHATEVRKMQVKGDQGGEVNFCASELQVPALAWIVDAPVLEAQLAEAVRFQPRIEVLAAPADASLTVICEGRSSRTRAEFGIEFDVTPYPQTAIAARLTCEVPPDHTARQWFAQGEILALLPMDNAGENSVALVWSVANERAAALLASSPAEFCQQLAVASQGCLGQFSLTSERSAWPLQMARAQRWTGSQSGRAWALAGDAAHNVHPLTGQGLNLGLADAAALAATLHERAYWRSVADEKLLRRYERSRKAEVWATSATTDGLQLLFAQDGASWQALRNWGLSGFERSGGLKHWAARQAMKKA